MPRPRIGVGLERAALPLEWPVLLDHAAQRRASRPSIEPDDDLLGLVCRRGWEEPEEHLAVGAVPYSADGQGAGVALAYVKVDIWDSGAVDDELCVRGQQSFWLPGLLDAQVQAMVLTRGVGIKKRRRGSLSPHNRRYFSGPLVALRPVPEKWVECFECGGG